MEVVQAATMPMEPEQLVWQQSAVVLDKDRFQHRRGVLLSPFQNRRLKRRNVDAFKKGKKNTCQMKIHRETENVLA